MMATPQREFWVSIQRGAVLLGMSDSALRDWIRAGNVPNDAMRESSACGLRGIGLSAEWIRSRLEQQAKNIHQRLELLAIEKGQQSGE
jgi:hypothetical protein